MSEVSGRNASNQLPDHRSRDATSSRSASAGNRFSIASTETGESSKRSSITVENGSPTVPDGDTSNGATNLNGAVIKPAQDARGSHHRSHRSRGSASFLVSKTIVEPPGVAPEGHKATLETPIRRRDSPRERKGKVAVRSPEKRHKKRRSSVGLGIGGSPLATNVTNAAVENAENASHVGNNTVQDSATHPVDNKATDAPASKDLDVESAQIVNLALNLSESRRNAARRNVSTPLPQTLTGFNDSFVGGSLRQHLQMQRRSSRNVSPKPERGAMGSPRVPSGHRMESPFQGAFGIHQDGAYQYHFSASTLARAEKAKKSIELMAQYRRLLQHVPPLKPQVLTRTSTRSPPSTAIEPSIAPLPHNGSVMSAYRQLGRSYNPLQYIRNRKVRLRERKNIDGELQGFGDVDRVKSWVDQVSYESSQDEFQSNDCVQLPTFVASLETATPSISSPQSNLGRNQPTTSRVKRPRVDWITNPADMLADVYWLEQNDNKKLIEDNRERKIFPLHMELSRIMTHRDEETAVSQETLENKPDRKLHIDTQLPSFNSMRNHPGHHRDSGRGRALQKLHSITHLTNDFRVINQEHRNLDRSSSESSENERRLRRPKFRRNATADNDMNSDILEKQMLELLAKESSGNGRKSLDLKALSGLGLADQAEFLDFEGIGEDKSFPLRAAGRDNHGRKDSRTSLHLRNRGSLEVPGFRGRHSLEGLDSTDPCSPVLKAATEPVLFMPSIATDLSPPSSRRASPTRHPAIAKVKSKISSLHDRSRNHSRSGSTRRASITLEEEQEKGRKTLDVQATSDGLRRSTSPVNKVLHQKTDDSIQSTSSKSSSIRRRAEEAPAGIKGLFKSGRNRVSDLIWKKEISPDSIASSDTSTDDSDLEDRDKELASSKTTVEKGSKTSSHDASSELSPLIERRSYELPVFASPFDARSRPKGPKEENESPESDYVSHRQRAREQRRLSRFQMLQPPRIDVQSASPATSPDIAPNRTGRDSDVSDIESHRGSSYSVQRADARLNSILGMQGHPRAIKGRDGLPITGLAHLEDNRRKSSGNPRHWSISDRGISTARGPITKREIARVRTLLLGSGIKAKEISRRAAELQDLSATADLHGNSYSDIVALNRDPQLLENPVPRSQAHVLAARILSADIQLSSQVWQSSASHFSSQTIGSILDRVEDLQDRILGRNGLSEMTRQAEREADDVSRDLVEGKTMAVKELLERMDKMIRRRRRRFRWVRRAGWVAVEWVLVGGMWWVWLVFVIMGFVRGTVRGVIGGVRWLLWL